ncbi:hypothetical protein [Pseudomonas phage JB10]|uniref:Uncharacterized protein n=1 Tax=Pseudomonas phage JB10 TaxID=3028140 RepID=A0AAF0CZH4_9CAUD|nr:hypothetical protein [Pseudomonas phage JB10]
MSEVMTWLIVNKPLVIGAAFSLVALAVWLTQDDGPTPV